MPEIPIVVLGAGAVGKSCLTIQYIQGHFVDKYDPTIEDVYRKPVDIDGQPAVLTIVDTAGQDAFGTMRETYMKTGQAFVLVYSITDTESFQQLKKIYAQLRRTRGDGATIPCIVVGNKLDLAAQRAVATDEGQMFARQAGSPFMEISAKDRLHVEDLFTALVRLVRSGASPAPMSSAATGSGAVSSASTSNAGSNPNMGAGANANEPRAVAQAPAPVPAPQPVQKPKKKWKCSMV